MITRYLFRNPRVVWLIVFVILVAGASCLAVMPRMEDPILKRRVAVISTGLYGADPAEIESAVTIPIEQWLNEFSEIKQVRSNTRANVANVVIELKDRVNEPDKVWSAIKSKISDRSGQLPEDCTEPELTVFPLKAYAAILAIVPEANVELDPFTQRRLAKALQRRILNLEGTESVDLFADPGEELAVLASPEKLVATGLSIGSIANQIADSNNVPAGTTKEAGMQMMVDVRQPEQLVQQIEEIFIQQPVSKDPLRLSEVAKVVRQTPTPRTTEATINDKQAIVLGVMVDNNARVDLWSNQLGESIEKFTQEFGSDYSVVPLFEQSKHVAQRMGNLLWNLTISAVAVALIAFLLMGWRCMIVVAVSLPLSAGLVICGLRMLSIPIHQMSVTGLIVALGLLIDNAIVMVEEVRSRIFRGIEPLAAMTDAVRHLGMPLFGSTLTTILAFLPIATMPGPAGEFVGSIAVSVILAISASFLLAITVIPPLVFLLGVNSERQSIVDYGLRFEALESLYRQSLKWVFRTPWLGVVLGATLPLIGYLMSQGLQKEFFPASDRTQIQIELELPASATLESVRDVVQQATNIVEGDDRVLRQHWFLGESAPTFYYNVVPRRRNSPSYAQAFVDIDQSSDVNDLVNSLQSKLDSQLLSARLLVRKLEQGPPFDAPVEVRVFGEDLGQLERIGNDIRKLLADHKAVTHTRSDLGDTIPKLSMELDDALLRETQLTSNSVSKFLYSGLEGVQAGEFFDRGEQVPVHVRFDFADRPVIDVLSAMKIISENRTESGPQSQGTPDGRQVGRPPNVSQRDRVLGGSPLLGSLGEFQLDSDVGAIIRIDGQRVNEVKAYLHAGTLPSVVTEEFRETLQMSTLTLPEGYRIEFGGEAEKRSQAVSTLIANAVVLVAIMILTLVAILGSFRSAFLIALVGAMAIGLAPLSLFCFGFPFGFMAIVGAMGLVGVAINDSIVVLAAIRAGHDRSIHSNYDWDSQPADTIVDEEALHLKIADVGESNAVRSANLVEIVFGCTRHILTTTLTTMIGFLPLVINGGKFWPPLAIVISAGVAGATLLALYSVPSMYLLFRIKR